MTNRYSNHFAAALDDDLGLPLEEDVIDLHRNAPRPDGACLYGLIGDIARAGSTNTEANPFAIAASMLTYLGAAVGRGPFMPIGDKWNHANLFMVHIGRSSLGRKGTAKGLMERIAKRLAEMDEYLAPQLHTGGLSTREGLALLIHDGWTQGKEVIPAIDDKRLLVYESEFANVLQQSKREGNTLSSALRDASDGVSIKPAIKTSRVWATDPHIGLIGDVTPSELRALMHTRELTNGFANRFIFFWAEGDVINPYPKPTPDDVVDDLVARVADVLRFAGADRYAEKDVHRMELSLDAIKLYANLYRGELRDRSAGEGITGLLDRRAPMLLRMAMLFALTDLTYVITPEHINAALAWVRYWVDSVKFVFQSAVDEAGAAEISKTTDKIISFLTECGKATRTELSKVCFGGHVSKDKLDKALDELLASSPPAIEVVSVARQKGQPGSSTKYYKPYAKSATSAKSVNSCSRTPDVTPTQQVRTLRNLEAESRQPENEGGSPELAHFAEFESNQNHAVTSMGTDNTLNSQISHSAVESGVDSDDVEVI